MLRNSTMKYQTKEWKEERMKRGRSLILATALLCNFSAPIMRLNEEVISTLADVKCKLIAVDAIRMIMQECRLSKTVINWILIK